MMRHFHKDFFSKTYYSPMQLHKNQIGDSLLNYRKFCIAFLVLVYGNWAIGIFSANQKVPRHIITKTCPCIIITKICPCNIQRTFSALKIENLYWQNLVTFNMFAQNIYCGYTLEPSR